QLKAREVNIIRGICRQVDWYGRKRYDDGLKTTTHGTTPENKRSKSE
ncbi:MAG: RNA methyltransferase, partial [Deltaproteobacteria bacterium]|nr:RNA methyltransferase [Deltaproteobacteria bacterium]